MAASHSLIFASFVVFLLLLRAPPIFSTSTSLVGVNYGLVADNLPSPEKVVPLLASIGVGRVKIYDAAPSVLRGLAGTGVELVVSIPNECVAKVKDPSAALAWARSNVKAYLPQTKISTVIVGNEVLTSNDSSLAGSLLPAMESVRSAIETLGLADQIAVTTTHSVAVLAGSYPPSAGVFRRELIPLLCPILAFHAKTGTPFLINAYPFFAYKADPKRISLDYALFKPNAGVVDGSSGLKYDNMLHAQIDAVYAAISAAGGARASMVEVRVSETGWPSAGDEDEVGATAENAAAYNGNLMKLVAEGKGTPMRPKLPMRVYVFALFNENLKPGPSSERNYGLFKPDGTPAYQLGITVPPEDNSTNTGGGGGGGSGSPAGTPPSDYYSFSAGTLTGKWLGQTQMDSMVALVIAGVLSLMLHFV